MRETDSDYADCPWPRCRGVQLPAGSRPDHHRDGDRMHIVAVHHRHASGSSLVGCQQLLSLGWVRTGQPHRRGCGSPVRVHSNGVNMRLSMN